MGRTRTNYGSPITINTHVGEKYSIINVLQPLPYRVLLLLLVNVDLKSCISPHLQVTLNVLLEKAPGNGVSLAFECQHISIMFN